MDDRPFALLAFDADPDRRDFFLDRLVALAIRQAATERPDERRALGMALFSTFLDCMDLGLTEQACRVIQFFRTRFEPVGVVDDDDEVAA
jgi:hypothetical protein